MCQITCHSMNFSLISPTKNIIRKEKTAPM
jgi:hypothetical protein